MLICDAYKPYIGKRFDAYSRIMGYENKLWSYLVFRDILKCSAIDVGKCPICLEEDKLEKNVHSVKRCFIKTVRAGATNAPFVDINFFK